MKISLGNKAEICHVITPVLCISYSKSVYSTQSIKVLQVLCHLKTVLSEYLQIPTSITICSRHVAANEMLLCMMVKFCILVYEYT